jgi:class 3 adenylate cyclase
MAARLCQSAEPDAIVVSEALSSLLPDRFHVVELGQKNLKGFALPVAAFEVTWR